MKNQKKIIFFLLKFLGSYVVMLILYSVYLNSYQISESESEYICDPITQKVANQTAFVLNSININSRTFQHEDELSMKLLVNEKFVARVVEGCNALSVIILFIAFIIAFSGTFSKTILYIIVGSCIIYYINIARIAFIAIAIYEFPEYANFLHQIVFPLIIYGTTFLLWVFWMNYLLPKQK